MRVRVCWLCLLLAGCGSRAEVTTVAKPDPRPDIATITRGSDWPGFLGPHGDGTSSETGLTAPWPIGGLPVVWQIGTGSGYAMPAISHGRLYLFDRYANTARLFCLNSETGDKLWGFEYPTEYHDDYGYDNGPRCSPVVDGERVYIHGAEGMLHCLDSLDGKLIWKVDTKEKFNIPRSFFGVGSTPVIDGDLLLVQVGGSVEKSIPLRGNGTGIVAFNKATGQVVYQTFEELASYASPVLATMGDRRWCFLFAQSGLHGFNPADGKEDFYFPWRAKEKFSVNAANPVVVGNRVFISETYGPGSALLDVKPGSCKVVWSDFEKSGFSKSMRCHWSTPIYHDGYLYGCSGRHPQDGELRCIELATGKVMWSQPGLKRVSLLLVDGHFICLSEDGLLLLLKVNPHKYEEVSRIDWRGRPQYNVALGTMTPAIQGPCWAAPILAHGLLYIRTREELICMLAIPPQAAGSGRPEAAR